MSNWIKYEYGYRIGSLTIKLIALSLVCYFEFLILIWLKDRKTDREANKHIYTKKNNTPVLSSAYMWVTVNNIDKINTD